MSVSPCRFGGNFCDFLGHRSSLGIMCQPNEVTIHDTVGSYGGVFAQLNHSKTAVILRDAHGIATDGFVIPINRIVDLVPIAEGRQSGSCLSIHFRQGGDDDNGELTPFETPEIDVVVLEFAIETRRDLWLRGLKAIRSSGPSAVSMHQSPPSNRSPSSSRTGNIAHSSALDHRTQDPSRQLEQTPPASYLEHLLARMERADEAIRQAELQATSARQAAASTRHVDPSRIGVFGGSPQRGNIQPHGDDRPPSSHRATSEQQASGTASGVEEKQLLVQILEELRSLNSHIGEQTKKLDDMGAAIAGLQSSNRRRSDGEGPQVVILDADRPGTRAHHARPAGHPADDDEGVEVPVHSPHVAFMDIERPYTAARNRGEISTRRQLAERNGSGLGEIDLGSESAVSQEELERREQLRREIIGDESDGSDLASSVTSRSEG